MSEEQQGYISRWMDKMKVVESYVISEGHQEAIFIFFILIMLFLASSSCSVLFVETAVAMASSIRCEFAVEDAEGCQLLSGTEPVCYTRDLCHEVGQF